LKTRARNIKLSPKPNLQRKTENFFQPLHGGDNFFKPAVQPKLTVNDPGDKYEHEADAMAEKVMMAPAIQRKCSECEQEEKLQRKEGEQEEEIVQLKPVENFAIQRKCSECEEEEKTIQRKENANTHSGDLSSVETVLSTTGTRLDKRTREFMENRFGYDFGHVQVHNDSEAHQSSAAINAKAYTHQNHIVFGSGQYEPNTDSGKRLLAHELTHVVQQSAANNSVALMRKCDPALFAGKTAPTFLPKEKTIVDVFKGSRTLKKKQNEPVAIGIIQQALVDLKIDLGKSGPAKNGVDRDYGDSTAKGVEDFQTKNSLPVNGPEIDTNTLKCLDQERISGQPVVSNLGMTRKDLEITRENVSSDQNIFFTRGSSVLDASDDATTIHDFINKNKGAEVTPQGFVSEDEFLEFGTRLADDRAKSVLKALQDEQAKMKLPKADELKFKPPANKGEEGIGIIDYPATRRVHLDITGKIAATGKSCNIIPKDWNADHTGPCDKGDNPGLEASTVAPAIKKAQELLKNTQDGLEKKDKTAKDTVATWFGSEGQLGIVTSKIKTWRKHLDTNLPAKHQCGDECHSDCDGTGAYNSDTGSAAMMTLCPLILDASVKLDERALFIAHEAGHGSIGTTDLAYDFSRLISVLQTDASLALKNTDSYIFMIKCFNGLMGGPCKRPDILGNFSSLSASSDKKAEDKTKESIAWLERWTDWVWQDVNVLYGQVSSSRQKGVWPKDDYSIVLKNLNKYFGISRRPAQKSPATLGEEVFVGAMNAKLLGLHRTVARDAKFILDTTGKLSPQWDLFKAPQEITVLEDFFKLGPRARVKFLLKLLVAATPHIASGLEDSYVNFIDEESKTWFNKP
jgi:peptidoglycan hydrolase-like protein with peptidoglycan-binding domain